MNVTVMWLTVRTLLGRRRFWLLLALSLVLLVLSVGVRALTGTDDSVAWVIVSGFGVGTLVPLIALLAGTGSIGPEIDDGSIVFLLSKPVSRFTIVGSKLVVAVVTALVLGLVPVVLSVLLLAANPGTLAPPIGVAAAAAVLAYCALFLLLSVLTRNAVIIGLLYAIVWETTVANLVPGARTLSVRQWSLSLAQELLGNAQADRLSVNSAVGAGVGAVALVLVIVASTVYAALKLRTIRLATAE